MTEKAIIIADNVGRSYRRGEQTIRALHDISFSLGPGETVSITGPSGCGKTTLLMLLGGFDRPTAGIVKLNGVNTTTATPDQLVALHRKTCGFIFQSDQLVPALTLEENVALPLAFAGKGRDQCLTRAKELLAGVGLEKKVDALPREVSRGQRQRAAIARALANDPAVVLADEPTGSLDSATAKEVIDLILTRLKERDGALVMVTHDPDVAARTDRWVRMQDGRLLDNKTK